MNLGDLVVKLKADMGQYSANLSKATTGIRGFAKTVGTQMAKAGRAVLHFGTNVMRRMADAVRKYSKWVGLSLAGAFALSTRAAMKQEDAIFGLSAAMAASGEYTKEAIMLHKEFAASIQSMTKYGDEEVLMLMKRIKSLGVMSSRLQEAAKMAIGLAAATGRDVESMAMYVAMAMQGEFTMLRRYIPALRATEDATEQLAILTEFAARGFKIAAAEAETTSGRLKQMKNALGDILEVIGAPFLEGLLNVATAVRDWAVNNQDQIAQWAKRVQIEMTYMKDTLWSFIKFLHADWKEGWITTGEVITVIMRATAETIKIIFTDSMIALGKALPGLLYKGFRLQIQTTKQLWKRLGMEIAEAINSGVSALMNVIVEGSGEAIGAQLEKNAEHLVKETEETAGKVKEIWTELRKYLAGLVPPELQTDLDSASKQRDEAIAKLNKEGPEPFTLPGEGLKNLASGLDDVGAAKDRLDTNMEEKVTKWGRLWKNLSRDIANSMEDAFVSIMKDAGTATEAIKNMLDSLYDAMSRQVFQQFIMPSIFRGFQGMGIPLGQPGLTPEVHPTGKYTTQHAQHGLFAQRGADTIPIMASPGEGLAVIPRGMVDWMKHTYDQGGGGGGQAVNVTFNVNAIDAQNTARFLQQNQRSITEVVGGAVRSNHPFRRMTK